MFVVNMVLNFATKMFLNMAFRCVRLISPTTVGESTCLKTLSTSRRVETWK